MRIAMLGAGVNIRDMKKPCVVSNVIGNHDVIHNDENGFVCDEVSEFIDAIRSVQRDMTLQGDLSGQAFEGETGSASVYPKAEVGGETKKLVEKAYEDVMEKYNTQVMARSYAEIYGGSTCSIFPLLQAIQRWPEELWQQSVYAGLPTGRIYSICIGLTSKFIYAHCA